MRITSLVYPHKNLRRYSYLVSGWIKFLIQFLRPLNGKASTASPQSRLPSYDRRSCSQRFRAFALSDIQTRCLKVTS